MQNLEVNLSPHVNFIHGYVRRFQGFTQLIQYHRENGSGKSAILIAICACLGVKASDTNRGSSLKDLIKHGKDWSRIELTIMNEGPDAYFPDVCCYAFNLHSTTFTRVLGIWRLDYRCSGIYASFVYQHLQNRELFWRNYGSK